MAAKRHDPNQGTFAFVADFERVAHADGSLTIRPVKGRVVEWLTTKEVAAQFGVGAKQVCRWVERGVIPAEHVRYAGMRRIEISAEAVAALPATFAALH